MRSSATCFLFCLIAGAVLSAGQPAPVSDQPQVIILRPAMAFSDYRTDATLPAERYGGEAYAGRLRQEAVKQLQKFKIESIDQETISDPAAREAAGLLQAESSKLARGVFAEGTRNLLARASVAANSSQALVLVHNMKVKLGPNTAWSPEHGLLGPQMTTTLIQASLISCRTGRAAWQGQGFLRALPGVNSVKFGDLLKELYKDLETITR